MHPSRIFLYLCLSFILGVFVASLIFIPKAIWLGFLALAIFIICFKYKEPAMIAGFCLIFIIAGLVYYQNFSAMPDNALAKYNNSGFLKIKGVITSEPEIGDNNLKIIVLGSAGKEKGKILVIAPRYPEYKYGDELELFGKLIEPRTADNDSNFNYKDYLSKDGIYSIMYNPQIALLRGASESKSNKFYAFLYWLKNKFEEKINRLLPEPQASFLNGLILGQKKKISDDFLNALNRTGTTHLVALSGYNITIIAVLLMAVFNFFMLSRRYSFWLAVAGILSFTVMVGASPSVVRAAVMGILVLIARQTGRLYAPTNALIFAGTVMVLANPKILRFDLAFQLSFLATCGLIYLEPLIRGKFKKLSEFMSFKDSLVSTLSAQFFVLPLILISFGNLSLIAPLANVLVLPITPLIMVLGFAAVFLSFIFFPLGQFLGWFVWLFLTYQIKIIEFLAKIPLASIKISFGWIAAVVYYMILAWIMWRWRKNV